jgi:hypothetical protein
VVGFSIDASRSMGSGTMIVSFFSMANPRESLQEVEMKGYGVVGYASGGGIAAARRE